MRKKFKKIQPDAEQSVRGQAKTALVISDELVKEPTTIASDPSLIRNKRREIAEAIVTIQKYLSR